MKQNKPKQGAIALVKKTVQTPSKRLKKSLLDLVITPHDTALETVRLGRNDIAVVFFSDEFEEVLAHYCEEPEIRGYVRCNGSCNEPNPTENNDCVLGVIGRPAEKRLIIPVLVPVERRVGVLTISDSRKSGALLPQILEHIAVENASNTRRILFIQKPDNFSYRTSSSTTQKDDDLGDAIVAKFVAAMDTGEIDLINIIPSISNEDLLKVPAIAKMHALKHPHK